MKNKTQENNQYFLNQKITGVINKPEIEFAFIGVPYEGGCAGRLGTKLGPDAVRLVSKQYSWPNWNGYYEPADNKQKLTNVMISDLGDVKFDDLTQKVGLVLRQKGIPIIVGGDHSITYEVIEAYRYPIQVLQFDAHGDYQRDGETDSSPSGTVMRKISNLKTVTKIVQVGMRGFLNSGKGFADSRSDGNVVIPWNEAKRLGVDGIAKYVDPLIPVYLSIDSDFFDPSIMPGTTVPEPDGPNYGQAWNLIGGIAAKFKVVGFDFVELNSLYDGSQISALHGVKLILDLMVVLSTNE